MFGMIDGKVGVFTLVLLFTLVYFLSSSIFVLLLRIIPFRTKLIREKRYISIYDLFETDEQVVNWYQKLKREKVINQKLENKLVEPYYFHDLCVTGIVSFTCFIFCYVFLLILGLNWMLVLYLIYPLAVFFILLKSINEQNVEKINLNNIFGFSHRIDFRFKNKFIENMFVYLKIATYYSLMGMMIVFLFLGLLMFF